jgi:Tol biopolymer transport system component
MPKDLKMRQPMIRLIAIVLLLLVSVGGVHGQLPADATWRTMETAHFRVTYHEGLEELARHAAAVAERAHAALKIIVGTAPRARTDIMVTDHLDVTNGWATPFPSNRIAVYARPPVDVLELQYTRDWVEVVVVHELAHIFHLDASGGAGRLVRGVFGRVPMLWPVFNSLLTPLWSIEGLAVGAESSLTSFGRVNGSYHEMIVRTAALESRIDDLDRLGSTGAVWPGPARAYIYGSLFMDYLTRRYGPDATSRLVRSTTGAIIPPPLWFNGVARNALGTSFREAYRDWTAELDVRYVEVAARLTAEGLNESERLTTHGRYALHPRFSMDGSSIAYSRSDGRTPAGIAVIDAASGADQWARQRVGIKSFTWLPDNSVVVAEVEHADRHRMFSDLYRVRAGERTRLTHGARLDAPDATRDGSSIVAVQTTGGTNRLVVVDPVSGTVRVLTAFDPDIHWALPRWAPDGLRIAVSRWRTGGEFGIVVLDSEGVVQLEITDGIGVNSAVTWSPDGQWLLFASDRTGIPNIYAVAVGSPAPDLPTKPLLRQVTNVLTGAFFPDVSPDGATLVFSRYHHDGYSVERMPFDPQSWRDPQAAALPRLAAERPSYETAEESARIADSVRSAMAGADTTVHGQHAYRDIYHMRPHYWLPMLATRANRGFVGASTSGADLVNRHEWSAGVAIAPSSGRSIGRVAYEYRGLPTLHFAGLHPSIGASVQRDWTRVHTDTAADYHVDRRDDLAAFTLRLERMRVRTVVGGTAGADYLHRSRYLFGPPTPGLENPSDRLLGLAGSAYVSSYEMSALAVSRENGGGLRLTGRQRWDRDTGPGTTAGTHAPSGAYREFSASNTAYLALPLPGFARHVLAVRSSLLFRDGPGATTGAIGGSLNEEEEEHQAGRYTALLPLRGFESGARSGTRAWTASAEYRFPLALVSRSLAPLRVFVDRLGGTLFVDAGDAWCAPGEVTRWGAVCGSATPRIPLLSAGGELVVFASFWEIRLPVRVGVGIPLHGGVERSARAYVAF